MSNLIHLKLYLNAILAEYEAKIDPALKHVLYCA